MAAQQEFFLVRWWYQKSPWLLLLLPLSWLYGLIASLRRRLYQHGVFTSYRAPVPVIVVGNITVGGTGKTPLVIALVKALQQAQFSPGIISRGYGSKAPHYPYLVSPQSDPQAAGDEPLLIARRSGVPVVIDQNRGRAAQQLLASYPCDVIITDDGLQHYALQRDVEIVVVDASRGFGNYWLLPAGPLRETVNRLATVDFLVSNGEPAQARFSATANQPPLYTMSLQAIGLVNLRCGTTTALEDWSLSRTVHAVAGIGNPQRFYTTLRQLGFTLIEHSFDDHHPFTQSDILFDDELPVIMTEKDAVKIASLQPAENCWYLPVQASIDAPFYQAIVNRLQALHSGNAPPH